MKNLFKNLFLLTTVLSLTLFSCGDEDPDIVGPDGPTASVDVMINGSAAVSPATAEVGDEVSADIDVLAPGNFNVFRVFVVQNGSTIATLELPRADSLNIGDWTDFDTSVTIMESIPDSLAGSEITLEFEVVDDNGEVGTPSDFVLMVEDADANVFSPVTLEVPLANQTGQNFFSTTNGEVYSANEVTTTSESISPTIDFGYYYGSTDSASIASPAGFENTTFADQVEGWNTKNATVIKRTTLDASAFTEVQTNSDIDEIYDEATDEEGVITKLSVGSVVAFETVDGRRGLILVSAINGTFEQNDNIVLDVLVQSVVE